MFRRVLLAIPLLVIVVGIGGAVGYLFGARSVRPRIVHLSATGAAQAMRGDHFYSDYRTATLLIAAVVARTENEDGHRQLMLETTSPFSVICQTTSPQPVKPGSAVTVVAEGARAVRRPAAVVLADCEIVG